MMYKKKMIQFGAGNIGRSFIGQLFSRSGYLPSLQISSPLAFAEGLFIFLNILQKKKDFLKDLLYNKCRNYINAKKYFVIHTKLEALIE